MCDMFSFLLLSICCTAFIFICAGLIFICRVYVANEYFILENNDELNYLAHYNYSEIVDKSFNPDTLFCLITNQSFLCLLCYVLVERKGIQKDPPLNLSFMYLPYTTTKMHNKMIPTQIQYSLYISLQHQFWWVYWRLANVWLILLRYSWQQWKIH
jgi:hypothetical protein